MAAGFLDVRRHGFARVAVSVPPVRVADPAFNATAQLDHLRAAHDAGCLYVVGPELGLTGYTCGDLFAHDALLTAAIDALGRLIDETARWHLVATVGLPLRIGGALYNCAVTFAGGRPVAIAPKAYPPNYREFYELRWFQPARAATALSAELLGQRVPFGSDLLVEIAGVDDFVLHTEVCEDLWVPIPPSARAALAGATVLANLSASNVTMGKHEYRRDLVRMSSAKNLAVQLYGAAGFGESTADLAWDGHGMIADRGVLLTETPRFAQTGAWTHADVDLAALVADRIRQTSFAANAADHVVPLRRTVAHLPTDTRATDTWTTLVRSVSPYPFVPTDPSERDARCAELFAIQSTSLARRLAALPAEARRMTIGVSGGRDSTHALLVAVHAADLASVPRSDVLGITMPGFGTSSATYDAACRLVRALGATLEEIDIRAVASQVFTAIGHDPTVEDLTFENVQAWTRKLLLFSTAGQRRGIDVGTGDLSELALGFATYGGDHMSHYGVNAGVPKTLIAELIRWAGDTVFRDEPIVANVLRDVLALPISPELLRPATDGSIAQRSEEVVGPYELHDFFLYYFLRFGFGPRRVARLALHAFQGAYDLAIIKRWLLVFLRRFFASQFKRDCVPDGPKVGSGGALSPRGDWRMPSDASVAAWIAEAETIPG